MTKERPAAGATVPERFVGIINDLPCSDCEELEHEIANKSRNRCRPRFWARLACCWHLSSQELEDFPEVRGRRGQLAIYLLNRQQHILLLLAWLAGNAALFWWKYTFWAHEPESQITGHCFSVAKGSSETLKLNLMLILLPASRNLTTLLRPYLGRYIPFDSSIVFHQVAGVFILVSSLVHAGAHLTCNYVRIASADKRHFWWYLGGEYHNMQPNYAGLIGTMTAITGFIMLTVMLITFPAAMPFFRRSSASKKWGCLRFLAGFNAFFYLHRLLLIMYFLVIWHGSRAPFGHYPTTSTWIWITPAVVLYFLDWLTRWYRIYSLARSVEVTKAVCYPDGVLALQLSKPPNFKFRSGMYLFLQCPVLSKFEWHPFTISSAPSDPYLTVHVRAAGDWTEALHTVTKNLKVISESEENASPDLSPVHVTDISAAPAGSTDVEKGKAKYLAARATQFSKIRRLRLLIDAPYGAPTQDYFQHKVVLLIGAGVGITPFASVLKELLHILRRKQAREKDSPADGSERRAAQVEKVHLYWTVREQASMTWFLDHIGDLLLNIDKSAISIHIYFTETVCKEATVGAQVVARLQSFNQKVDNGGQKVVGMHCGRPDWDKAFSELQKAHRNTRVGVFFCGPAALGSRIHTCCLKHSDAVAGGTHFKFHSENF